MPKYTKYPCVEIINAQSRLKKFYDSMPTAEDIMEPLKSITQVERYE